MPGERTKLIKFNSNANIRMSLSAGTLLVFLMAGSLASNAQQPSYSTGLSSTTKPGLIDCGRGTRVSAVGEISAEDGTQWIVPAATNFETVPTASDLFNECGGEQLTRLSELKLSSLPVFDAGGDEEFVAYNFADNYLELYVNGKLLAVDPVPFTKFNSNVVRFTASRPVTLAVMGVDWEENLGLGSEQNRGARFFPGDAGFVAQIRDVDDQVVALTDATWKAQTFYTAPLSARDCLVVSGALRDSSDFSTEGVDDGTGLSAAHWPVPDNWMQPDFDDTNWPDAVTFTNETVGVRNKPA